MLQASTRPAPRAHRTASVNTRRSWCPANAATHLHQFLLADISCHSGGMAYSTIEQLKQPQDDRLADPFAGVSSSRWRTLTDYFVEQHRMFQDTELAALLEQESFSPLRLTGDGLQHVYLTSISDALAQVVIGLAGESAAFSAAAFQGSSSIWVERELSGQLEWEDIEQRHVLEGDIPVTTRRALVQARVGQGLFKDRVSRLEKRCRLTFVDNPTHLVGSHIKPWRESSNEERLHGANGLLLTPTADHLFDHGFISFEDSGEILISPVADVVSLRRMGLDPQHPPHPLPLNTDQKHFLSHHRREIFLAAV
jgi:putative restriction endonuclease